MPSAVVVPEDDEDRSSGNHARSMTMSMLQHRHEADALADETFTICVQELLSRSIAFEPIEAFLHSRCQWDSLTSALKSADAAKCQGQ